MKPTEGRRRVVIEEVQPQIEAGRYPAKRVLGDTVEISAAIFSDGHDHVAARLHYHHKSQKKASTVPFAAVNNDIWSAKFTVDKLGTWFFTVEAWVDHFDTWVHDLGKRLAAQPDPQEPTQQVGPQDIPLALRIGANHVDAAAARALGADATKLKLFARELRSLAEKNLPYYEAPKLAELIDLMAKYPDLSFSTMYPVELPIWVDRERARFSSWYELFPRSAS